MLSGLLVSINHIEITKGHKITLLEYLKIMFVWIFLQTFRNSVQPVCENHKDITNITTFFWNFSQTGLFFFRNSDHFYLEIGQ